MEWLTIIAIIVGPVLAVQAQKWIERAREKRNLRLYTFKRLMATRGAVLSPTHVEALNMIDLEFAGKGKKDVEVRQRWEEYLDNLTHVVQDPEKHQAELDAWSKRNNDLLVNLLVSMSRAVGYNFTSVQIRRGVYTPLGHANFEFETQAFRRGWIQVLLGNRAIPMDVRSFLGQTTASRSQTPTPAAATGVQTEPPSPTIE